MTAPDDRVWRTLWNRRIQTVQALHRRLLRRGIPSAKGDVFESSFSFLVTPYYADLIRKADLSDPIYRQCVPDPAEAGTGSDRDASDPFHESDRNQPVPGVIRRYSDRAVVFASGSCAVHCRHCTRRHGLDGSMPVARPGAVHSWLTAATEVREVLLSGGDPLLRSDAAVERLLRCVRSVPHVRRIRVGTRLPVVLPQRITPSLGAVFRRYAPVWVATHFNHPAEITPESIKACAVLVDAGVPILNQTVLLRGVNNEVPILAALFQGLADMRVKPYYLLHCDPVAGVGHFRVAIQEGLALMDRLRSEISGLAVPVYAADVPGAPGKVPLSSSVLLGRAPGGKVRILLPGGGMGAVADA